MKKSRRVCQVASAYLYTSAHHITCQWKTLLISLAPSALAMGYSIYLPILRYPIYNYLGTIPRYIRSTLAAIMMTSNSFSNWLALVLHKTAHYFELTACIRCISCNPNDAFIKYWDFGVISFGKVEYIWQSYCAFFSFPNSFLYDSYIIWNHPYKCSYIFLYDIFY